MSDEENQHILEIIVKQSEETAKLLDRIAENQEHQTKDIAEIKQQLHATVELLEQKELQRAARHPFHRMLADILG